MVITVKLFANFRSGRFKEKLQFCLSTTTVQNIVQDLGIIEDEVGSAYVNGQSVPLAFRLNEGDMLALFPLIGGG